MRRIFYIFSIISLISSIYINSAIAQEQQDLAVCAKAASCSDMGFTMTAQQCKGIQSLKCPFDQTKYFCNRGIPGEIRIFAGTTPPEGWLILDGAQLSSISYPKLYATIKQTFGGNSSNFNLPDATDRFILGAGPDYSLATKGGEKEHKLTIDEMPSHNHGYGGTTGIGSPDDWGNSTSVGVGNSYIRGSQIVSQGGYKSHNNMPPYIQLKYIIYSGK